jgi:hypothetical protein
LGQRRKAKKKKTRAAGLKAAATNAKQPARRERFLGFARNDTIKKRRRGAGGGGKAKEPTGRQRYERRWKGKRAGGTPALQNAKETADPSYRLVREADEFGSISRCIGLLKPEMTNVVAKAESGEEKNNCRPEGRRYIGKRASRIHFGSAHC